MTRENEQNAWRDFPENSHKGEVPNIYRAKKPVDIEREIEFTLLQMNETLASIEDQLSPQAIKNRIKVYLSKPSVRIVAGISLLVVARRKPFLSAVVGIGGMMYALNRQRARDAESADDPARFG